MINRRIKDNLYISIYFSQALQDKSSKYGQPCYLLDVIEDPDDLSHEFNGSALMAEKEGESASYSCLPRFLCDDWVRVHRIEVQDALELMPYLEETLIIGFDTPKIARDIADLACSYAHHANDYHTITPSAVMEHFGILLTMDESDADKLSKAFLNGKEFCCDCVEEFMLEVFLTNLKITIGRAIREFGYQHSIVTG